MFSLNGQKNKGRGFTLIEMLIGAVIFSIVSTGAYNTFTAVLRAVKAARVKTEAMMLANERIEIARNLSYADVGIVGGVPVGKLLREETVTRNGMIFNLVASVRNVDDPFDGQLGSSTKNDLSPADYKQVEYAIGCVSCLAGTFATQTVVTTVAPRHLETASGNGALFIRVFNSAGDPVTGATVRIENDEASPAINITEVTNAEGEFRLIDAPPGALAYDVTISKTGYSTDSTVAVSAGNPNPLTPPSTVLEGMVTQVSFAIDKTARLTVNTINPAGGARAGMAVRVVGQKKIGLSPDVFKYDQTLTSNASGKIDLTSMEWDTYDFLVPNSSSYALAGTLPTSLLSLSPGSTQEVSMVLVPKKVKGLVVVVLDAATGLPLSNAEVTVGEKMITTDQGYFNQTDWSGGGGQALFESETMFADTDGNLDGDGTPGELKLRNSLGTYLPSGWLTSSVFDTGSTTTQYVEIGWDPADQPASTNMRFQIASGNDPATSTWNYYGPDGTAATYYTTPGTAIHNVHNGDRYVRYKAELLTELNTVTPNLSSIHLTYTSLSTPPGQAYFDALAGDTQSIAVTREGYQTYTSTVSTALDWQRVTVLMQAI